MKISTATIGLLAALAVDSAWAESYSCDCLVIGARCLNYDSGAWSPKYANCRGAGQYKYVRVRMPSPSPGGKDKVGWVASAFLACEYEYPEVIVD